MLTTIHPKLPMRNKSATKAYYIGQLGFINCGAVDYDGYLMLQKTVLRSISLNLKSWIREKIMDRFIYAPMILMGYISPY